MTETQDLLRVRDLVVRYRPPGRRSTPVTAVDGVSLDVPRGTTIGLVGESGSGKSSIGSALLGLVDPAGGTTIEFDGADITHAGRAERRLLARRMQVVFQDPYGSMDPARTVGDTITEALRYNLKLPSAEIETRLRRALDDVSLPAEAAARYPAEFSGGQRQRIAIARAIVVEPEFVVCDEAVSALDLSVQAQVLNLLAELKQRRRLSYLFISHDLAVVAHLADRTVVLYAGRVVEEGPAAAIAGHPAHPYARALVAAAPVPDPAEQARRRAQRVRAVAPSKPPPADGCDFAPRCPFAAAVCWNRRPVLATHGRTRVACHRVEQVAAALAGGGREIAGTGAR